jgi:superfamily II RNA helicase
MENESKLKYSEQFKEYHINKIIRKCEFCETDTTDLNKPICNECSAALKEMTLEYRKKKQNLKIENSHKLIGTRSGGEILLFFQSNEDLVI